MKNNKIWTYTHSSRCAVSARRACVNGSEWMCQLINENQKFEPAKREWRMPRAPFCLGQKWSTTEPNNSPIVLLANETKSKKTNWPELVKWHNVLFRESPRRPFESNDSKRFRYWLNTLHTRTWSEKRKQNATFSKLYMSALVGRSLSFKRIA